jgi:hypothetical protein
LLPSPSVATRQTQARAGGLAREVGFTDIDGHQVPPFELDEA